MFEGVSADEMADGENLGVERFEEFGEDVENGDPDEIRSARVARGKEEKKKREGENGGELDGCVKAEVAVAMEFTDIPLDGASCSEDEQRREGDEAGVDADAF